MKKFTYALISIVVVISVIIIATSGLIGNKNNTNMIYVKAKAVEILEEKLGDDYLIPEIKVGTQQVKVEILEGDFKGLQYNVRNPISRLYNVKLKAGMTFIAGLNKQDGKLIDVSVSSYARDKVIYVLLGSLFLILIVIGGMKGIKSVISLIFSGIVIIFYLFPAIFRGGSPILSAIISACVIAVVSMLLISGLNKKTASAIAGIILGVVISGSIAYCSSILAHLSGLTIHDADYLLSLAELYKFNIKGLLFTGILIASLGAIMDIGISIASSIFEMHSISPSMGKKDLFQSGMNVGKDMIGTMTNTLILAFTGASLNMIIFIIASKMQYNQMINMDALCSELIQALSGCIALVLTVPITAFISVAFIKSTHEVAVTKTKR